MNIMAFDLDKFNSVMCLYNTNTQEMAIETVGTERDYMGNLITHYQPNLVVVEGCGSSGWISDLRGELKIPIIVCNTNEEAWFFKTSNERPTKTTRSSWRNWLRLTSW